MLPKISVIMPNYNYAKFLEFSLGSICRQTIFPFECIVIDDASTDNSIQIIKKYKKLYPFIRLIENTSNQGAVNAIKLGLKASIGLSNPVYVEANDTISVRSAANKTGRVRIA